MSPGVWLTAQTEIETLLFPKSCFMELWKKHALNEIKTNQILNVIIDREDDEFYVGRTEFDSPEVDGEVLISKEFPLKKGQFCLVEITGSDEFDLYGKVV